MRHFVVGLTTAVLVLANPAVGQDSAEPTSTRPFRAAPVRTEEYVIGSFDLLQIKVFELQQLDRTVRVTAEGAISLPLLGEIRLGGLTPQQAEEAIAALLRERNLVKNPQVTVFVEEFVSRRIFVQGAVSRPGIVNLLGDRTLLDVIGEAGGLNREAGNQVFVIRPFATDGVDRIEIDAEELVYKGNPLANLQVQPGDIVMIPYGQDHRVFVNGAVSRPGPVEFKSWERMTVLQAVTAAGGATDRANEGRVQVIRRLAHGGRHIFKVNLKRIKRGKADDLLLERNDIVVVPESFF